MVIITNFLTFESLHFLSLSKITANLFCLSNIYLHSQTDSNIQYVGNRYVGSREKKIVRENILKV